MGIPLADWQAFCAEHDIAHAPEETGGNIFYRGGRTGVQCIYGGRTRRPGGGLEEKALEVMFLSPWGGPKMLELAALARAFWVRFGGALYAETELRPLIVNDETVSTLT
jgi:hypothetical protein